MTTRFLALLFFGFILSLALFAGSIEAVSAGPPSPLVVSLSQPDGRSFNARAWGDERSNGMETLDGYTILKDPASGYWVYAERSAQGDLVPARGLRGNLVVGKDTPGRLPKAIRPARRAASGQTLADPRRRTAAILPNWGVQKILVILAQFPDRSAIGTTPADWNAKLFGPTGSLKAYLSEASYNIFTIAPANESHGTVDDGIVGWLTLASDHPGAFGDQHVEEAIHAADPYVNFADYDSDDDGYISSQELHIVVIAAGYEQSYAGSASCSPAVWAHQSYFISGPVVDGKAVATWYGNGSYITLGEVHCASNNSPGHAATIGPFAHELGHDLAWPDLYDIDDDTAGIGNWGVMGAGLWNKSATGSAGSSPAHPDAWSKWYQQWLVPTPVTAASPNQAIAQVESNPAAFLLRENPGGVDWTFLEHSGSGEYLLVENRQQVGFDVGLPSCGLLVWHVDESVTFTNSANADQGHRLVDLKQADGMNHLGITSGGNTGDDGDPFPGATVNRTLNAGSNPNSHFYGSAPSGISIANISDCGSTMTADLDPTVPIAESPYRLYFPIVASGVVSSPPPSGPGIYGRVTLNKSPLGGISLKLMFDNSSGHWVSIATTTTTADGKFVFSNVPSIVSPQTYYVRYDNPGTPGRLLAWQTRYLYSYTRGSNVHIGDFDLADIILTSPASGAQLMGNYLFEWQRRAATPSDSYHLALFNPTTLNPYSTLEPLGYVSTYKLFALPWPLRTGTTYGWRITVETPDGAWGSSYEYRTVMFQ